MNQDRLRKSERELTRLAANDLAALWRQVSNYAEAESALKDVLPQLVQTYGKAAASVAADWYDEAREAADAPGAFRSLPASITDAGAESLADWASHHGTTLESIQELAKGGMSRRILNFSRETVMGSALSDPAADGWQRVGVGECDFCSMLISRGAVYTESSVSFASHDDCRCSAVPAFRGSPRPVEPYKPSLRQSDADKARAKKWIEEHR